MVMNHVCPSCGEEGLKTFYTAQDVPVHSCFLTETEKEALELAKGDIDLRFCEECGFISNTSFDPSLLDYSQPYEDQQTYSPIFNMFAEDLANRLVKKYSIYNKDILEIGCGKGDFLALLCEFGENRGLGIDPAYIEGRIHSCASNRMRFMKDYYSEKYKEYSADLICCRHTLEHIQNTAEFLTTVRQSIGEDMNTIVFFEVPDVSRILREAAFWDIYYEHCSYFSCGSLSRLFKSSKFEVNDLYKGFDDQYIMIEAKPTHTVLNKTYRLEEDPKETARYVKTFSKEYPEKLTYWKKFIDGIHEKRTVFWGSGSKCVSFLTTLQVGSEIEYVIDINPNRHGKFIPGAGKKIMPPGFLRQYDPDLVLAMNPIYLQEIERMLGDMELDAEVVPVA